MEERSDQPEVYTEPFITHLQLIWGEGFLSPGGPEEIAQFLVGLRRELSRTGGCGRVGGS